MWFAFVSGIRDSLRENAADVLSENANAPRIRGFRKGVRNQSCAAPIGPFGYWFLTPFLTLHPTMVLFGIRH
jgi:hypothetical protein